MTMITYRQHERIVCRKSLSLNSRPNVFLCSMKLTRQRSLSALHVVASRWLRLFLRRHQQNVVAWDGWRGRRRLSGTLWNRSLISVNSRLTAIEASSGYSHLVLDGTRPFASDTSCPAATSKPRE